MRYGVCGNPGIAVPAAEAGFDYFEWSVAGLLKPLEDEASFQEALNQARSAPLPCEALNVFVPAQLKITGPQADIKKLYSYAATALQRAEKAEVKVIVFGSGGARHIPDNFPRPAAWDQLVEFCGMLSVLAELHGVIIAIEPLNRQECNVINSVPEALALARAVQHPAIRVLVDAYHWCMEREKPADLIEAGPLLAHAHIATLANRLPPAAEPHDFSSFFTALQEACYDERMSIEGRIDNPPLELPAALELMKTASSALRTW